MPSDRRQFNIRFEPEVAARFDRLLPRVSEALGVTLTQAQLIALALSSLEEKYPPKDAPPAPKGRKG